MISIEEVTNGIFELIRKEIVYRGYYPDMDLYQETDVQGWKNALQAIKNSGKELIQLHSIGSFRQRTKEAHDIIIDRINIDKSELGKVPTWVYETTQSGRYKKEKTPSTYYDIVYQVTYITDTEKYAGIIEEILMQALSNKKLIIGINDNKDENEEKFWVFKLSSYDTSGRDFIERGHRYQAKYLNLERNEELGEVAKFNKDQFEGILEIMDEN